MQPIHRRRARAIAASLVAPLVLLVAVAPAAAGPARAMTLASTTIFDPNGNHGTFTASGPAVDAGLICASGSFVDTGIGFAGFQGRGGVQIVVFKTYSCPAGDVFVKMQIQANPDGTETFSWVVKGGTGPYSDLRGAGRGTTEPNDLGNVNTFVGMLTG